MLENNFYILSTGRTSTSFLSNLIKEQLDININFHQKRNSRLINICGNLAINNNFIKKKLINFINNPNSDDPLPTVDPLKTIAYCHVLKELSVNNSDKFNAIKIIHIVRDPRDFVTSFMNWKDRKLFGKIVHNLIPYWTPKPSENSITQNIKMKNFEKFCWAWQIKNQLIHKSFSNYKNYYFFKFENLTNNFDSLNTLILLLTGNNIDIKKTETLYKVNQSKKKSFKKWNYWSKKNAIQLDNICHELMAVFDYGNELEWLEKIKR